MKQNVGHMIKCINDKIKCRADADMKSRNITLAQGRVLAYLCRNGGEATQKEIETFLDISHPTVVGIITRMERNGYITCSTDNTDKRKKIVRATDMAANLRAEIVQTIEENERAMLRGLTDEETENLKRMLTVIYNNL